VRTAGYPVESRPNAMCAEVTETRPVSSKPLTSLESLVDLKWHDDTNARTILLRILTELYVEKPAHSADEEQQFVELILRLLDAADPDRRREVAAQLAGYAGTPRAVALRLESDVAKGAEPILRCSLPADDIVDFDRAELEHESVHHIIASATELSELFFTADPAERRMILMNLDNGNGLQSHACSNARAVDRLEASALQGRSEEFVRELGRTLQISPAHAQHPSGEPLVVAAKVLAVSPDILQRILLCINPAIGHSVRRIYNLIALHRDMSIASARQLLAIWQQAAPRAPRVATHLQSNPDEQLRPIRGPTLAPSRNFARHDIRNRRLRANARHRQGNDGPRDPRSR
jgi:hypothetical protein